MKVYVQKWTKSERNWGMAPDGYSVHMTPMDRIRFLQAHHPVMADSTFEYRIPLDNPQLIEVSGSLETLLLDSENGCWVPIELHDQVQNKIPVQPVELTGDEVKLTIVGGRLLVVVDGVRILKLNFTKLDIHDGRIERPEEESKGRCKGSDR